MQKQKTKNRTSFLRTTNYPDALRGRGSSVSTNRNRDELRTGFAILEVLVAASIISISLFGVLVTTQNFLKVSRDTLERTQAAFLLAEGTEALRVIRDRGWAANIATLSNGTTYYLDWSGGTWKSTTTKITTDNLFVRSFVTAAVYRDGNDDIAPSGTLDSNTRKFTATVSWKVPNRATSTKSTSLYLTNFFNN